PKGAWFAKHDIGYHDDSFTFSTLAPPAWHFSGRLAACGEIERWRTQPIAGEIRPENQAFLWDDPARVPAGQEFSRCTEALHASWMLAARPFSGDLGPQARALAEQHALELGYELFVSEAEIDMPAGGRTVAVNARLRNTGVAPFYMDWPVELAVLDGENRVVHRERPGWSVHLLLPDAPDRIWAHGISTESLKPGDFRL